LHRQLRSTGAEWVAEGNRAAIDVELIHIKAERARDRERLGCEGLVKFDQVNVVERQTRQLKCLRNRHDRTNPHHFGRHATYRERHKACYWLEAERVSFLAAHDDDGRSAVAGLRSVARCDRSARVEHGLERSESF